MKKTILSFAVFALAFVPALQADELKACDKSKATCADAAAKATTCDAAKAKATTCSDTAKAASCADKACCAKKTVRALHSPRGAMLAKR